MGSNSFGRQFTITTFGESHGLGIGVVIDGCPANLWVDEEMIEREMQKRRPGQCELTSPRNEEDKVQILSGVFEGYSTGAPLVMWIENKDHRSTNYDEVKNIYRVGHSGYSYMQKYGIYDYRGGGRTSARETAARVASGAIAKMLIDPMHIEAELIEVGGRKDIIKAIEEARDEGDSIGGVVGCRIKNVPAGLGDPIYEKIEANLAKAMLSINACCGFSYGRGFDAAKMKGSEYNDQMQDGGFLSNNHGGILGGITTGEEIYFEVAFKPTSSIKKSMKTMTLDGENTTVIAKKNVRHDPCVALRAKAVVEAMAALVLVDFVLLKNCSKI